MSEWLNTTLGDLCADGEGGIQTGPFGSQLHASDYVEVGTPVVMPQNIRDNYVEADGIARISDAELERLERYELLPGDIVYSRRGDVERRALIRSENAGWLCGTGCLRVRLGDGGVHDSTFVSYALGLKSTREWIVRHAVGATMLNLNTSILSAVPLSVPSLDEQRAVAEVLGALDEKIAANRSLEATSDELVNALYARSVRHDAEERHLFDVFHVDFGEAFKGTYFTDPGVGRPLIRIRDLKTFTSQVWTTEQRPREILVRPGDVVVGMDAEFRATWWLGDDGLLNQRVCRVRGRDSSPAFVAEALRGPLARIERSKSATTVIHLNKRDLEQATVLMPTDASLRSFEAKAQPVVDHRVSLARQRNYLVQTRDALLPLLMSGRVTVKDAESVVEGVA